MAVEADRILGYLYAEERHLFDLIPNIRVVEVTFLVGGHGAAVPLLRWLRGKTRLRIFVPSFGLLHRPTAFQRLLRPLEPEPVAVVYQI